MPKWLSTLLHILAIGGGVAGSIATGTPWPLALTSTINALIPSPVSPVPPKSV